MDIQKIAADVLGDEGEPALARIDSSKVYTLTFDTNKLLEDFGYPTFDDLTEPSVDWYPDDDDLLNIGRMYIEREEDEDGEIKFLDYDDTEVSEEAIDELKQAMSDAGSIGTERRVTNAVLAALSQALENMGGTTCEYMDSDMHSWSVRATGIIDASVNQQDYDEFRVKLSEDTVHLINAVLGGYGMFTVEADMDGESPKEYIQNKFHQLADYYDVYGERKPKPDYSNVEDFDAQYFKDRVREIEQEYGLRLL